MLQSITVGDSVSQSLVSEQERQKLQDGKKVDYQPVEMGDGRRFAINVTVVDETPVD